MTRAIHVEIQPPQRQDGKLRVSARITGSPKRPRLHPRNGEIYFDIAEPWSDSVAIQGKSDDLHDVFARATIVTAMEARRPLVIHGNVSTSLIENLHQYQLAVHGQWPRLRPVEVRADAEITAAYEDDPTDRGKSVIALSGGLDSCYSLYCHTRGLCGDANRSLGLCVLVRGFDMQISVAGFADALARVSRIADSVDLPVATVSTNLRSRLPPWPYSNGSALGACLSLFDRNYSGAVVASSVDFEAAWERAAETWQVQSTRTDPFLSAQHFSFLHDPPVPRAKKSEVLRDWQVATRNLRICMLDLPVNCGSCEKCLRQMFAMRVAGVTDFSAFTAPYEIAGILKHDLGKRESRLVTWNYLLQSAEELGTVTQEEMRIVRDAIKRGTDRRLRRRLRSLGIGFWFRYVY